MSAEVVSLNGTEIPIPGTRSQDLIDFLEKLLEQARAGEVVGVVGARIYPSTTGWILSADSFCMGWANSYSTIGALEDAKFRTLKRLE